MSFWASVLTPIMTPKAISGTTIKSIDFKFLEGLNTLMAPAQRPIIKLPQYIETNGAI